MLKLMIHTYQEWIKSFIIHVITFLIRSKAESHTGQKMASERDMGFMVVRGMRAERLYSGMLESQGLKSLLTSRKAGNQKAVSI